MDALVWEDAASYQQLVQGVKVCKALTIFIHLSLSMCPHDVLVARVVLSDLGFEISHLLFSLTPLVVVGRSHLSSRIIGGNISLDVVQLDVFLLSGKLGCDDVGVDRLPADECRMYLWCQHQGHTPSMMGGGGWRWGSILDVS